MASIKTNKRKNLDEDFEQSNKKSKQSNKKSSIWEPILSYIPSTVSNALLTEKFDWVSATKLKNYLIKDPILDWFSLTRPELLANYNSKPNMLFENGYKFEEEIYEQLQRSYKKDFIKIAQTYKDINRTSYDTTRKHILSKRIPIIAQGVLYNDQNKTFGCADLLIRNDFLEKIFNINPNINPNSNSNTFYVIVDIKWTTLQLCSDGIHLRNSDLIPAYKAQLAIYTCALGMIQDYFPDTAYIMGKGWTFTKSHQNYYLNDPFDRLGHISYLDKDNSYLEETAKAIQWIRTVRSSWNDMKVYPKPSCSELYPNLNNHRDEPYHQLKQDIAMKIGEVTMLYSVGHMHRTMLHSQKIYSWKDKQCNASRLGITGNNGEILDKIVQINLRKNKPYILPKKIINNLNKWHTPSELDFYIDYETLNLQFVSTLSTSQPIIFMIGLGYIEDCEWKFKCFKLESASLEEERRIISEFKAFIVNRIESYKEKHNINQTTFVKPRLFHWTHVEKTCLESSDCTHNNIWTDWLAQIEWIDLHKIFKSEPIVVKGAFGFGLKNIASAMYKNRMIQTCWGPSIKNGFDAMMDAIAFYRIDISDRTDKEKNIMSEIISYNEVDCKVMYEIVDYLRKNLV
jgi:hypothetical protein